MIHQSVGLDCLSDEFLNDENSGSAIASMKDFDEIAAHRLSYSL